MTLGRPGLPRLNRLARAAPGSLAAGQDSRYTPRHFQAVAQVAGEGKKSVQLRLVGDVPWLPRHGDQDAGCAAPRRGTAKKAWAALTNEVLRWGLLHKTGADGKETYVTRSINLSEELRGFRGLWQYLITRSQLKARVEIERERSRAYADHRDRLPDNAELMDYEDDQGRKLWIRKNGPSGMRSGQPSAPVMAVRVEPWRVAEVPCLAGDELTGEITS